MPPAHHVRQEGEDYEGEREEAALDEFIQGLGPGCSADTLENCDEEQKAELEEAMAMTPEARATELEQLMSALQAKEKAHEALLEELQAKYDASDKALDAFKKESKPRIKVLKRASPKATTKEEL